MMRRVTIALFLIMSFCRAEGQKLDNIEKQLLQYANEIDKWDTLSSQGDDCYDSLKAANKSLLEYIKKTAKINYKILSGSFKQFGKTRVNILSSGDKKIRLYCWDVGGLGSARSFNTILVYSKSKGSIGTLILNDDSEAEEGDVCTGDFYDTIYTVKLNNGEATYLLSSTGIASHSLYGHEISAYKLQNGKIGQFPIFKTKDKTFNSIGFGIDYLVPGNEYNNYGTTIKLSSDSKTMYIPLINSDDVITGKYLVYKFDGKHFVYQKK